METGRKLAELTRDEISDQIDAMEDVLDTLDGQPQGTVGALPQDHYDQIAIRREQRKLIDKLIRRGEF